MHFLQSKIFSTVICLGFEFWSTTGSGGKVGDVIFVLRPFPKLMWVSVQNLVEIVTAVCA